MCACAIQVQCLLYCSIRDDSKQSCRVLSYCSLNEAFCAASAQENIHIDATIDSACTALARHA